MNFETRPTMLLEWKFCLKNAEVTVQREDDKKQLLGTDSGNGLAEGKKNPHRHEPKFPGPHLDCHMLVRVQWDIPSVPPECQHAEITGFPDGSDGKGFAREAGDTGSIPGSGRSPGVRDGNPLQLQYSCLENSRDTGTWPTPVHGVTEIRTQLSN